MKLIGLLFVLCSSLSLSAQSLIRVIEHEHIKFFKTDELENIYVVDESNVLYKYGQNDSTVLRYSSLQDGTLTSIDATDPLNILLLYASFGRIVCLDNLLSRKSFYDLRRKQIFNVTAAAMASDGKIWVFDTDQSFLLKLDGALNTVVSSNNLRQELQINLAPATIIERNKNVYVGDKDLGLFIFDRYGALIDEIVELKTSQFQIIDDQIVFFSAGEYQLYDLKNRRYHSLTIPSDISGAITNIRTERNKMYVQTVNKIYIYSL